MNQTEIVFITLSDLSEKSGSGIATKEIVEAFARNSRISLTLICPKATEEEIDIPQKVSVYHIPKRNQLSIYKRIKEQLQLYRVIKSVVNEKEPAAIVARMNPTLLAPAVVSKKHQVPYILLARGVSYKNLRFSPLLRKVFNMNARQADRVYAAYSEIKKDANSVRKPNQTGAKIFTNAVDPEKFSDISIKKARAKLTEDVKKEEFVVGSISTMKEYHKIDELIRAVSDIQDSINIKLLLVGDGPERNNLENIVENKGMSDKVIFTGFVPHERVSTYISSSDILYGAADSENAGNPIKCYEYLACGRPIITTDTPEFSFVERINVGEVIKETKKEEIKDAIMNLYNPGEEERQEMGERGRKYVLNNHTWDSLADEVLEDILEIQKSNKREES